MCTGRAARGQQPIGTAAVGHRAGARAHPGPAQSSGSLTLSQGSRSQGTPQQPSKTFPFEHMRARVLHEVNLKGFSNLKKAGLDL